MKTINLAFILLISFLLIGCSINKGIKTSTIIKESPYQSILDSIFEKNQDAIGLMVHIESPTQNISWSGSVGYSEKGSEIKIIPTQPALIASNTKTYVSAAILRLIEEKKISLDQSIESLLYPKTSQLFSKDNYQLKDIKVKHLLSHTSGIQDYVDEDYMTKVDTNQSHRWTRDEQLTLAVTVGDPLGIPGEVFRYADANYLLLTEIIERQTNLDFYTAIRELLKYKQNKINSTWFISLETKPNHTLPLVHQYFGELNWDSYKVDPSFDLYGGGGIAATTKDLALFSQALFEGNIIKDQSILDLIYTEIKTKEEKSFKYYLGLGESDINGLKAYGHGGFWGTTVMYIPALNTSVSVFVLERDKRALRADILELLVKELHRSSEN